MNLRRDDILCDCKNSSHILVLEKWDDNTRTITVQLSPFLNFWQRLKAAFKYVLQPTNTASWDSIVINEQALYNFRNWCRDNEIA